MRSTSLSILGIADEVRTVFSEASGLAPAWFSFNSKGACPACKGKGYITTELAFLDDVATPCDECDGERFNDRALSVTLDGRSDRRRAQDAPPPASPSCSPITRRSWSP
ncbi:MAG: hypothetical protein QM767_03825 [Anaeromyxobacter sp.]